LFFSESQIIADHGLTGVKHIVEQHGGTIEVDSREGRGSTFTVRLPVESAS
jgi:signal transduction histidine kinase